MRMEMKMETRLYEDELRQLVDKLDAAQRPVLHHLLSCPACQDWTLGLLLEDVPDGAGPHPGPCRVETLAESLPRDFAAAEALGQELMRLPKARRAEAAGQARFHRLDVSLYLLARSREVLAEKPEQAADLAETAVLIQTYEGSAPDRKTTSQLLARAWSLIAQSRLRRRIGGVEQAFDDAAFFLAAPYEAADRGRFCRALGQLRWEQGRLEEALALLRRGAAVFAELGLSREEAASLCLIGLLCLERGDSGRVLAVLARGRRVLQPLVVPWLVARADLALAFCLADQGKSEQAERLLTDIAPTLQLVQDKTERLYLSWWAARVGARLGHASARNLLETLFGAFQQLNLLPEVALVALDLALAAAESGASKSIAGLEPVLVAAFGEKKGREAALAALRRLAEAAQAGEDLRQTAAEQGAFLRSTFRFHGYRVEPLPPL